MSPRFGFRGAATLVVVSLLATACDNEPSGPALGPVDGVTVDEPRFSTRLFCEGDREALTVTCEVRAPAGSRSGGPSADLIVGNQGTYMELASTNVAYDSSEEEFTFDVTVKNLLPQPIGTKDGIVLDSAGVRVFFHSGPDVTDGTGTITVVQDSIGTFTSTGQPYYQYDEIIASGATSAPKTWTLEMPATVVSFAFTVYVAAEVPAPDGFVQLDADSLFVQPDSTYQLAATIKSAVGKTILGTVTFASSDTTVAVVDPSGLVTGVRSGFATITASAENGELTGTAVVGVCPKLQVGETMTFEMPYAAELCLWGGNGEAAEYVYSPVNTSTSSSLSLSLTGTGIVTASGPPTPQLNPAGATPSFSLTMDDLIGSIATPRREAVFGSPIQPRASLAASLTPGEPSRLIVPGVPTVGDVWNLNVAAGCTGTIDVRTGRVVSVSSNFILVADTMNPPGGFTTAHYDTIALELDTLVWQTLIANFDEPADLDNNGERIVVFFTRALNELSPPASSSVTFAKFETRDLFSSAPISCPLSNEGEMLYAMVPDPTGQVNSNVRTVSFVRGNIIRELARELLALINASRRIYVNAHDALEEEWLEEGLKAIAEELVFYRASVGLAPGSNIDLSLLTTGPSSSYRIDAFNKFALPNFERLEAWLQRPDTTGAFRTSTTLASQGVLWAFLRYAADRADTTNQEAFWEGLIDSGLEGKANLANAIGADPDEWLRDFIVAIYADDIVSELTDEHTIKSWNFRSVYSGLGGFPLVPRPLSDGVALTLSYSGGGGTAFARFGVPADSYARLTTLSGGVPPAAPLEIALTRTK